MKIIKDVVQNSKYGIRLAIKLKKEPWQGCKSDLLYRSNFRMMPLSRYSGFNALELMMVLAVIGIATGVVVHTMSGNANKQNGNQMVSDITSLMSNIKNAYSSSSTGYTSLTTAAAIQAQLIPADLKMLNGGSTVQNQFQGGTVDVTSVNNGEAFSITYTAVPSVICNSTINSLISSNFITITVNGTEIYNSISGTTPNIDPTATSAACNNAANSLVFIAS